MLAGCAAGTRLAIESLTLPEPRAMIGKGREGSPVVIFGELTPPPRATGRVPAVILAHGCGGFGWAHTAAWTDELARQGFASLSLDSFGGRGIREVCSGQEFLNMGEAASPTPIGRWRCWRATRPSIRRGSRSWDSPTAASPCGAVRPLSATLDVRGGTLRGLPVVLPGSMSHSFPERGAG